jgi:hypothetical protein
LRREIKGRSKKPDDDPCTFYFSPGIHRKKRGELDEPRRDLDDLFALKPDAIALEPTGMRYSSLLARRAEKEGVPLLWVGHAQCANYRKQMKLPDKNDLADALALACYGFLYREFPQYFIHFESFPIDQIRELYLQLKSLSRFETSCINRLKQQLAYEFPEAMEIEMKPLRDGRRSLICFLADRERPGIKQNRYWENRWRDSVARDLDIEISSFTQKFCEIIDDYDQLIAELSDKLEHYVNFPIFCPYNRVFDRFNFGLMVRAALLIQIYPIERFESIGAFKRRVGAAKVERSSGSSKAWSTGDGSRLSRCELFLWVVTAIACKPRRPDTAIGRKIAGFFDDWIEKYYSNSDYYQKMMVSRVRAKIWQDFESLIDGELSGLLKLSQLANLKKKLATLNAAMDDDGEPLEINTAGASKRFGKLIVGKTVGFTARWLYRELKREIG